MPPARPRVDTTDMRILAELLGSDWDGFRSDRVPLDAVAGKLGLHRNTVSARVRRLTAQRVYLPPTLDVEAGRFGLVGHALFIHLPREARTAAAQRALFEVEGVAFLWEFVEGWALVVYAPGRAALQARVAGIAVLLGATRVVVDTDTERDFPPAEPLRLTRLDVALMTALLDDARVSFRVLARRLGVQGSSLSRRYERLRRAGALYMFPGSCGPIGGVAQSEVVARIPEERRAAARTVAALDQVLPNRFIRFVAAKGLADYIIFAESLADLQDQFEQVRRVPGVREAEFRTPLRLVRNPAYAPWLAGVVARHAAPAAQATPRPRATAAPS